MNLQTPSFPFLSASAVRSRRRTAVAAAIAVASLLAAAGCSSTSAADSNSVPPTTARVIDRPGLQSKMDTLIGMGVPGVVVMVADGDQSLALTAGVSNLETGAPMAATNTFRIASMTKPYTATVVLQLVDEGKLALDDTVEQWLPGIVTGGDRITIRQLLQHTSGVADYFDDPAVLQPYLAGDFGHVWTPQQLIAIADHLGSTSAPGTEWRYSNTNYAIVGLVVEAATGRSLGTEMKHRIFDRLGLKNTTFATDTTVDAGMAHGYLMSDGDPIDVTEVYPFAWGAGNIVSDAADSATFYDALLTGELLPPELLAEMMPKLADDAVPYGLGLMAWELPCGVAYGHDGGFAGYSTRSLVRDDGRQVVILANSITIDDHLASDPAADAQFESIVEAAICG